MGIKIEKFIVYSGINCLIIHPFLWIERINTWRLFSAYDIRWMYYEKPESNSEIKEWKLLTNNTKRYFSIFPLERSSFLISFSFYFSFSISKIFETYEKTQEIVVKQVLEVVSKYSLVYSSVSCSWCLFALFLFLDTYVEIVESTSDLLAKLDVITRYLIIIQIFLFFAFANIYFV